MGYVWVKGSAGAFQNLPELILERLRKRLNDAMEKVIQQAVEDMKRFTSTRPTAKSGKQGRIETGQMLEAIAGKTFNEGVDKIVGEFGFLDRQELYFKLQTNAPGFTHWKSGALIEPTFAMRDSALIALNSLLESLNKPL